LRRAEKNNKLKLELEFGIWNLEIGFGFGIWKLEIGFGIRIWNLKVGSWILDFGFWMLDFGIGLELDSIDDFREGPPSNYRLTD
jgi:hypothetical protein